MSRYICGENDVSFEKVIAFHEGLPVVRFVLVGVNEQAQVGGRSLMLSIPETERVCSQLLKELSGSLCSQVCASLTWEQSSFFVSIIHGVCLFCVNETRKEVLLDARVLMSTCGEGPSSPSPAIHTAA